MNEADSQDAIDLQHTPGVRVPGLTEGLEIIRVQTTDTQGAAGEFAIGDAGDLISDLYRGAVVVRALPGYEIRFHIRHGMHYVAEQSQSRTTDDWLSGCPV